MTITSDNSIDALTKNHHKSKSQPKSLAPLKAIIPPSCRLLDADEALDKALKPLSDNKSAKLSKKSDKTLIPRKLPPLMTQSLMPKQEKHWTNERQDAIQCILSRPLPLPPPSNRIVTIPSTDIPPKSKMHEANDLGRKCEVILKLLDGSRKRVTFSSSDSISVLWDKVSKIYGTVKAKQLSLRKMHRLSSAADGTSLKLVSLEDTDSISDLDGSVVFVSKKE